MTNKMLLCEGKCSLSVPIETIAGMEFKNLCLSDKGEEYKTVRKRVTAKLKMTQHKFTVVERGSFRADFMFTCTVCGQPRNYGMVQFVDPEIKDLYGI